MNKPEKNKLNNSYLKYAGVGFQMIAIIGIFCFLGIKLDAYFKTENGWTLGLTLFGVICAMLVIIKDFIKKPKK